MRELIKQQLQSCSYASLTDFNSDTNTFTIPRYTKPHYELGKMYLVRLSGILINNTTSVVAVNYNRSTAPTCEYLKIFVSKTLGKMIYVDSLGFDMNTKQDVSSFWSGWLPVEELTLISNVIM